MHCTGPSQPQPAGSNWGGGAFGMIIVVIFIGETVEPEQGDGTNGAKYWENIDGPK